MNVVPIWSSIGAPSVGHGLSRESYRPDANAPGKTSESISQRRSSLQKNFFVPGKQKATTDELERKQQHIFQTRSKDGALSRYKELVAHGVGRLLPTRASDNNTQSSGPTLEPKP